MRVATSLMITVLILLVGCVPNPSIPATPTKTPSMPAEVRSTATPILTVALAATAEPTPTATPTPLPATALPTEVPPTETLPPPTPRVDLPPTHYCMARPIPSGFRDYLDRTYAYGATSGGQYRPHTGVEFWNASGTPVVAVSSGTIVYAGSDGETVIGPETGFYGNLVILQVDGCSLDARPVYALYGHLSEVGVEKGQRVTQGEELGLVGGTGAANGGPHLHFEVRIDDPFDYFNSTRNPDLWITPYVGFGTLAGLVIDTDGTPLPNVSLTITGTAIQTARYTWTYAGMENRADDRWGENFTYGDLPEGWYTVTTRSETRTYSEEVFIPAGETAWLEFRFD